MAESAIELGIVVVADLDDAVLDAKGVERIFAEGVLGDFDGPALEVAPVEQGNPPGGGGGSGGVCRRSEADENAGEESGAVSTAPTEADWNPAWGPTDPWGIEAVGA